jgi:hypothetical protein
MDLKKFLPGNSEKESREYFWALVVEPGWVQAGIWRIQEDKAQIIFTGPPSAWELEDDLISAVDAALSATIQNFPEDLSEPSKTVFGVVSSWVAGGQIKEEYLEIIKKICNELSLKPVGFAVLSEAIAHYIKAEEGSPLNAVSLGVYKESLEVSIFKLGNLVGSTTVSRSVALVDDVVEGLSRFAAGDVLPSRFILYNGKEAELEDARQSLINVSWDEVGGNVNFLHTPKIEIIDVKQKVYAVSLAGASEMGDIVKVVKEGEELVEEKVEVSEQQEEKEKQEEVREQVQETDLENLGFAIGRDVAKDNNNMTENTKDIGDDGSGEPGIEDNNVTPVDFQESENANSAIEPRSDKKPLANKFRSLFSLPKKLKLPGFLGGRIFIMGISAFVLILGGGFGAWWYIPKATVTVYISPSPLEQRVEIVVDPTASETDVSAYILPGKELKTEVSSDKTKSTTGTKTVGENAKGKVVIFRVGSELNLAAGTVLHGPDSLRFTLDEAVKVASGSAGSAGQVEVSVTAEDIGAQYNLASGSTFRVGNYSTSDMEAKNDEDFSGGSSREINTVSADDRKDLEDDLKQELEEKARREIKDELEDGLLLIEESLVATASSRVFSANVGEEATTLKLNMKVNATALAIDRSQLEVLAQEILKDRKPDNYSLRGDQIEYDFEYKGRSGSIYKFEAFVKANLLPSADPLELAVKLKGKYQDAALEILSREVGGFVRADLKTVPSLPGRLNTLPRVAKNIDVQIAADR